MNIAECDDMLDFTQLPLADMSGFSVYVDSYTESILDTLSEVINVDNFYTYRECLSYATQTARERLLTRTSSGDKAFSLSISKVPFKIMGTGGSDHFAYSGSCAKGYVYTYLPERLIRDICNSPDLFIHEYAHVLHMSVGDSPQAKGITTAYVASERSRENENNEERFIAERHVVACERSITSCDSSLRSSLGRSDYNCLVASLLTCLLIVMLPSRSYS